MDLSTVDQIWNRAALESGGENAREGDLALSNLLFFHGMVENGGLGHGYDVLSDEELIAAIKGFRFFGLHELASFIEEAAHLSEDEQEEMSWKYAELVPTDEKLSDSFELYYSTNPEAFAPLQDANHQ
ncbi:MAG: hypothetical protein WBD27_00260 [Pyrinomonadaceae bacterium]